ncbi:MAG: hypothetical protein R3B48_22940 [Kofleriaceae bacterium]
MTMSGEGSPRLERSATNVERAVRAPYRDQLDLLEPDVVDAHEDAPPFSCEGGSRRRDPRETKGEDRGTTDAAPPSCGSRGSCG